MRFKIKTAIGLYQCIAAVPSVFDLVLPPDMQEYTQWVHLMEFPADLSDVLFVRAACFGSYRKQLLIGSSWPLVLLFVAVAGCTCRVYIQSRQKLSDPSIVALPPVGFWVAVRAAFQQTLPLTLVVTFVLVPSTATRIFKTFLCDPIELRRYLHDDLAMDCDSDEYTTTHNVAIVMLVVWPVGVPLLYALVLWANRKALANGALTPETIASEFLTGDYKHSSFWWEPLEMLRKITLTGVVLVIGEEVEQARVLAALLVSIAFLALHLTVQPLRRAEDGAMMMLAEVSLILVYLCVLLIKSCDFSSVRRTERDDELAKAVCKTYGFGETSSGVFQFFIFFGLSMVLLQFILGGSKLWIEGYVPRIILMTRAHSISPSTIIKRLISRRAQELKHRTMHLLRLDVPHLTPRTAAAILQFRTSRGRSAPPANTPKDLLPVVTGGTAELHIEDVFPRTKVFVQVDLEVNAVRWTHERFISLHTISSVVPPPKQKASGRATGLGISPNRSTGDRGTGDRSMRITRRTSISSAMNAVGHSAMNAVRATSAVPVRIVFSDRCGVSRALELRLHQSRAAIWADGLQELLRILPNVAPPAHSRWALSCMAATSERGATGFLRDSEVGGLSRRANASARFSAQRSGIMDALDGALKAIEAHERRLELPAWLRVAARNARPHKLLDARQITSLLLRLCTASQDIIELFSCYAEEDQISATGWQAFIRTEQLAAADNAGLEGAAAGLGVIDHSIASRAEEAELSQKFERAVASGGGELRTESRGLNLLEFSLQLLSATNSALAPVPTAAGTEKDPLAHYWISSSHNSYIIGDQITGFSSSDACISAGVRIAVCCTCS